MGANYLMSKNVLIVNFVGCRCGLDHAVEFISSCYMIRRKEFDIRTLVSKIAESMFDLC